LSVIRHFCYLHSSLRVLFCLLPTPRPPRPTLFPYTTLFRSRGELQMLGATTLEEYRKYIEKDAALERRFRPVAVEEPGEDTTLRSEEHTSELQSRFDLVCRLLLEKKKKKQHTQ